MSSSIQLTANWKVIQQAALIINVEGGCWRIPSLYFLINKKWSKKKKQPCTSSSGHLSLLPKNESIPIDSDCNVIAFNTTFTAWLWLFWIAPIIITTLTAVIFLLVCFLFFFFLASFSLLLLSSKCCSFIWLVQFSPQYTEVHSITYKVSHMRQLPWSTSQMAPCNKQFGTSGQQKSACIKHVGFGFGYVAASVIFFVCSLLLVWGATFKMWLSPFNVN